ncbi:MAG: hypothetical protein KC457_02985 [Myxococcales bacterium]|nr:hypothetical protein [Myxococcales bacterium]
MDQLLQSVARSTAPSFVARVRIDAGRWIFGLAIVSRSQRWSWWLFTASGAAIVSGLDLVVGVDLLGPISDPRRPPGQLFAVDTGRMGAPPGRLDLRGRVQLIYRPIADVAALIDTEFEVR